MLEVTGAEVRYGAVPALHDFTISVAEGLPGDIQRDPVVINAYLGSSDSDDSAGAVAP